MRKRLDALLVVPLAAKRGRLAVCAAVLAVLSAGRAGACPIPVFQYAMYNWPADSYEAVVFHRGPLDAQTTTAVEWLRQTSAPLSGPAANVVVRTIDLAAEPSTQSVASAVAAPDSESGFAPPGEFAEEEPPLSEKDLRKLWKPHESEALPHVLLRYPRSGDTNPTPFTCPADTEALRRLVDSPARREIARRLMSGDAAVWVLVECGQREKDEPAASLIEGELKKLQNSLAIYSPEMTYGAPPSDEEGLAESAPAAVEEAMHPEFSLVRVRRDDPREEFLVRMILNMEADLAGLNEPVASPVFGRGRALHALAGKGINPDTIAASCEFLVGDCSCQIKEMNPGVDLLIQVDWDAPPPFEANLSGVSNPVSPGAALAGRAGAGDREAIVSLPLLLAVVGVVVAAIVSVIVILRRSRNA